MSAIKGVQMIRVSVHNGDEGTIVDLIVTVVSEGPEGRIYIHLITF